MVFTRKHSANDSEKNGSSYRWIGRSTVDNGKCDFAAASPPEGRFHSHLGIITAETIVGLLKRQLLRWERPHSSYWRGSNQVMLTNHDRKEIRSLQWLLIPIGSKFAMKSTVSVFAWTLVFSFMILPTSAHPTSAPVTPFTFTGYSVITLKSPILLLFSSAYEAEFK